MSPIRSISITIQTAGERPQTQVFDKDEIGIGRGIDNDIRLLDALVGRRHARLLRQGQRLLIEDLGTANGVFVNDRRIAAPTPVRPGDRIRIGSTTLTLQVTGTAREPAEPMPEPVVEAVQFVSPAAGLGTDAVSVGSAFAFVHRKLYEDPRVQRTLLGLGLQLQATPVSRTEPLLGDGLVVLPGLALQRFKPAPPELCSVTSDKMLYQEGHDVVNLLIIDARGGGGQAQIEILLNGERLSQRRVELDEHGMAHVDLPDPLAGSYEVRLLNTAAKCTFVAAGYTLAALSAALLSHRYAEKRGQQELSATIGLRAYGVRFAGSVRVQLEDVGQTPPVPVGAPQTVSADDLGRVEVTLQLAGEGPFSLSLQSVEDSERTASLPLPGTRAAERRLFRVSRLGEVVDVSLLPRPGSTLSRGLHLGKTGETETTPVRLRAVLCDEAELEVRADIEALCLVMYDPVSGKVETRQMGDVAPGQVLRLAVPPWYGMLCAGGFVMGRPWEGWATVLRPAHCPVALEAPARATPGGTLEFTLSRRDQDPGRLSAFVVVRDARLQVVETPLSQLGAATKRGIEAMAQRLHLGEVDRPAGQLMVRRLEDLERDVDALRRDLLRHADDWGTIGRILPDRQPPPSDEIMYSMPGAAVMEMAPAPVMAPAMAPARSSGLMSMFAGAPRAAMPVPAAAAAPPPGRRMRAEVVEAELDMLADADTRDLPSEVAAAAPSVEGSLARKPAPAPEESEERPGEVLLCRLIDLPPGQTRLSVPLPEGPATYRVEALVLAGWDFSLLTAEAVAEKQLYVSLVVPPFCDSRDTAFGKLDVGARTGQPRVIVTRDGTPVPLYAALPARPHGLASASPREVPPGKAPEDLSGHPLQTPAGLYFPLVPGRYRAAAACGDLRDETQAIVSAPGRVSYLRQRTRLLSPGESVDLARDGGLRIKVLPGLDQPFGQLIEATADYGHACCEQTAAILLAAVAMYLCAEGEGGRKKAARIIRAGVAREERMWVPGKGFRMYPESDYFSDYYGPKAGMYLHRLRPLAAVDLDRELADAVQRGLDLAHKAAQVYRLEPVPQNIESCEGAYLVAQAAEPHAFGCRGALQHVRQALENGKAQKGQGAVAHRTEEAYAAATLLLGGERSDLPRALEVANRVIGAFNKEGRLYSTVDSVAAIALLSELRARGIGAGGSFEGDGEPVATSADVADRSYRSVVVKSGVATVQVLSLEHEELCQVAGNLRAAVQLVHPARGAGDHFQLTDRLTLVVRLADGYQAGDLLQVHLPPALSWVYGGGQVRALALDFAGRSELQVPLLCTALTVDRAGQPAPQHFALAVRNMFEEERGLGFPDLKVTISRKGTGPGGPLVGRISRAIKDWIG